MTGPLAATLVLLAVSIAGNVWALRRMARNRRAMARARDRAMLLQLAVQAELARVRRAPR